MNDDQSIFTWIWQQSIDNCRPKKRTTKVHALRIGLKGKTVYDNWICDELLRLVHQRNCKVVQFWFNLWPKLISFRFFQNYRILKLNLTVSKLLLNANLKIGNCILWANWRRESGVLSMPFMKRDMTAIWISLLFSSSHLIYWITEWNMEMVVSIIF